MRGELKHTKKGGGGMGKLKHREEGKLQHRKWENGQTYTDEGKLKYAGKGEMGKLKHKDEGKLKHEMRENRKRKEGKLKHKDEGNIKWGNLDREEELKHGD